MESIDAAKELARILQEEIDSVWAGMAIGYNRLNAGYHMGKGLMVNKETWGKYKKARKINPELNAYEFMVELIKEAAKDLKK